METESSTIVTTSFVSENLKCFVIRVGFLKPHQYKQFKEDDKNQHIHSSSVVKMMIPQVLYNKEVDDIKLPKKNCRTGKCNK